MRKTILFIIAFSLLLSISAIAAEPYGSLFTESVDEVTNGIGRTTLEWDEDEKAAKITVNVNDPWLCLNTEKSSHNEGNVNIDTSKYKYFKIEYKVDISGVSNPADGYIMQLYFNRANEGYSDGRQKQINLETDNQWHSEVVDMTHDDWTGTIERFRFDPVDTGKTADVGAVIHIRYMLFFETEEDANNFTLDGGNDTEPETSENPETSDSSMLFAYILVAAIATTVLVRRKFSVNA